MSETNSVEFVLPIAQYYLHCLVALLYICYEQGSILQYISIDEYSCAPPICLTHGHQNSIHIQFLLQYSLVICEYSVIVTVKSSVQAKLVVHSEKLAQYLSDLELFKRYLKETSYTFTAARCFSILLCTYKLSISNDY